jgi:cystathionine beta-lyase/cystathionine gamma-synthase
MAAISAAIFSSVEQGSHVVAVDSCYGPTKELLKDYLPKFGVETTFVEGTDTEKLISACNERTSVIYLESPSSLIFQLQDFEAIADFAKARGITTITDNSYASPIFQTPADFGIDIIVHSATKFLGGHSDIVAGALCTDAQRMASLMKREIPLFGAALSPFPAWLLIRGLRTLKIRMKAHEEIGNRIAAFLRSRPEIERVFHPSLPDHPRRDLFYKQMRGTSGLLSFIPKVQDGERLKRFAEALEVFQLGVSWGGFESLVVTFPIHPMGWQKETWFVRIHCGLEDYEILSQDLDQALRTHLTP